LRAAQLYCEWRPSGNTQFSLLADDLRLLAERPDYALWYVLSIVYEAHRTDQYAVGVSLLESLCIKLRQGDDRFLLAFALGWLGDFLRHDGRFPQAKAVLDESRAIYRPMWPHFGLAGVARRLTDTARQLGDGAAAQLYRAEAVRVCEQLDMLLPWLIGNELAEQAFADGDLAGGAAIFRREQESALRKGDRKALVNSLGWGSIYLARYGAIEEALAARQQVLALEEAISADDTLRGWHRLELGEIYRLQGDFAAAQHWYETAMAHFEIAQHANGRAQVLRAQADLALARGDYQQALAGFGACLAHFHQSDWWQAAYAENGLGRAYVGLGAPAQAQEHFKAALHYGKPHLGLTLIAVVGLAEVLESEGEQLSAASLATFAQRQSALWHETRVRVEAMLSRLSAQLPVATMTEAYAAELTLTDMYEIASLSAPSVSRRNQPPNLYP
jgi:tetratricopeptide (TPR) repeat protein